jgi:hypothetical protein
VIGGPTAKPDPTVQVEKVLDLEIARSIRDPITFDSSSSPGSRDLTTVSSDAALSVTFAGSPPAGGEPGRTNPLTPARTRAKINALSALRETADAALYPCLVAGTGTALFAGGLPGVAAGIVIEGVASPLCRAYIDTIRREAATVKDPPLSSIDTVARPVPIRSSVKLPSCRTLAAGARQLCNRLEPAARNLLATAARVESIAGAIATTVARDTAAANRRDTHAIAIQERALRSLLADAARARRAHARAGVALARALRAAGLSVVLTPTNTATAAKLVLARLAALGVSRATIQSLAGPELAPRSIDALATLGR